MYTNSSRDIRQLGINKLQPEWEEDAVVMREKITDLNTNVTTVHVVVAVTEVNASRTQ